MNDHEQLIDALSSDADPVRRPAPPVVRALVWASVCLMSGWIATRALPAPLASPQVDDPFGVISGAACLAAGMLLLVAALDSGIPGRRMRSLPAAVLCMVLWTVSCVADLATADWPVGRVGAGSYCFRFILYACAPMAVVIVLALRRTYSLRPLRTMLLAGGGVAFLSFSLLAFCHQEKLLLADFSMHLAAVALVIAGLTGLGMRFVAIPRAAPAKIP